MNWFFIMLRTFPFWGIPTAFFFIVHGIRGKNKRLWIPLGILMIVGSVVFLFLRGPFTAVPFMHDVLNSDRSTSP